MLLNYPAHSMPYARIQLASASPRRSLLLSQMGVPHEMRPVDIDESRHASEPPREYVLRLAREKADAGAAAAGGLPVLAADTTVAMGHEIFGKPLDEADGIRMLTELSARRHDVLTAVALACQGRMRTAISETHVTFRALTVAECRDYWASGEPAGKAGAYAIQGLGAVFIAHVEGSYSGVMGLPLFETAALLDAAGLRR